MERIMKCVRFQTRSMLRSTLGFTLSYIAVCAGLISVTVISDAVRISAFSSGLYIGAAIFVFIYAASDFRSSYNYLLIFGNTRKTISFSTAITNVILSVIMAVFAVLSIAADSLITRLAGGSDALNINLVNFMYPNSSTASILLFLTALYIMITSFATLYGSLVYKFGKLFITIFWVCFGLSVILVPASGVGGGAFDIPKLLEAFLLLNSPNGIRLASVNFIIAALIFSAAAYLISSRQPQTAPVT